MQSEADERNLRELTEASALHRYEATLLFGQLTVYLAMLGALFNAFFRNPPLAAPDQIVLSLIGIGVTLAFAVINHRGAQHLLATIKRAEELCAELGMQIYARRVPPATVFTGLNAVRFLYVLGLVCWLGLLVRAML
ncbi:hypothetical protein [Candidatus Accumulibacter vicinus]|uniref:Uncharacterized protein n=1 Tax=Candidatus Accumulibacter vicinus TaxID=2954382 RepID=A0A084XWL5_9PROT|nr:hypothetical protein [Candidatus Accumulibacter vicinus]KFB66859.1 MAG: hypothetical protein CAPSK01_003798 [Candidatus Accumulibacter vicinus]